MAELLKTTVENNHYHIAYLRDDGSGVTSMNHGHAHQLVFIPPQAPILDINGLEIQPGDPGGIEVLPAEDHNHGLEQYEVVERKEKKEDVDKVLKVLTMYDEAKELEKDSRAKGLESEDFYSNDQWEAKQITKLEEQDRAAITINQIAPKIDNLSG
ncbi:MAG: portal protein, partial [bacterium]